eukprot:4889663-Alexandrium_andersonii.AAC.1
MTLQAACCARRVCRFHSAAPSRSAGAAQPPSGSAQPRESASRCRRGRAPGPVVGVAGRRQQGQPRR